MRRDGNHRLEFVMTVWSWIKDSMHPRNRSTPSDEHSRFATVHAAGLIVWENRDLPEARTI